MKQHRKLIINTERLLTNYELKQIKGGVDTWYGMCVAVCSGTTLVCGNAAGTSEASALNTLYNTYVGWCGASNLVVGCGDQINCNE